MRRIAWPAAKDDEGIRDSILSGSAWIFQDLRRRGQQKEGARSAPEAIVSKFQMFSTRMLIFTKGIFTKVNIS